MRTEVLDSSLRYAALRMTVVREVVRGYAGSMQVGGHTPALDARLRGQDGGVVGYAARRWGCNGADKTWELLRLGEDGFAGRGFGFFAALRSVQNDSVKVAALRMTLRQAQGNSPPRGAHPHLNLPPSRGKREQRPAAAGLPRCARNDP